jgi:DNA polymerase I-like protein with 3'-5' exonuclease and polymerase domains
MSANSVFARDKSFEDFIKELKKGNKKFKQYRQNAKGINFSFLYNAKPYVLMPTIDLYWSEEDKDSYIKENDLEMKFMDEEPNKALTIAFDIHKKFMETYKGIPKYASQQIKVSKKQGYIDSEYGGRRHLTKMLHYNYKEHKYSKDYKHLCNIAVNTAILSFEALYMHEKITLINNKLKELRLNSKILGMVHDSVFFKLHRLEITQVYDIVKEIMEDKTTYSIPILIDCALGPVWGFGKEIESREELVLFEKEVPCKYQGCFNI